MKQHPPRQIFEKLVNENAIKRKIGGPPLAIFPETLDPPRNFGKNIPYPLPWIFNPCASMFVLWIFDFVMILNHLAKLYVK
jgi:hypothetical protein